MSSETKYKKCNSCGENKPIDQFYQRKNGSIMTPCKTCANKKKKVWASNNKDKVRDTHNRWVEKDIEAFIQKRREYAENHRTKQCRICKWLKPLKDFWWYDNKRTNVCKDHPFAEAIPKHKEDIENEPNIKNKKDSSIAKLKIKYRKYFSILKKKYPDLSDEKILELVIKILPLIKKNKQ